MRVVHVIGDLAMGGAETILLGVLANGDLAPGDCAVVSLDRDDGPLAGPIRDLGVSVRAAGMRRGSIRGMLRLVGILREERPDAVVAWMYHSAVATGLARLGARRPPVVWSLHHSNFDARDIKPSTILLARGSARLSGVVPSRVICCARSTLEAHAAIGYDRGRMTVVPNGVDIRRFAPSGGTREEVRRELGIPADAPVVGRMGRFAPQKDFPTFFSAAARIASRVPDVHFLLAGGGLDPSNVELSSLVAGAGLSGRCHMLGIRTDVHRIWCATDLAVSSSSSGEAGPLVVLEAMATGVPCVVTDVGDSGIFVGDTGRVVPPRDPDALARSTVELLTEGAGARILRGKAARERVAREHDVRVMARRYEAIIHEVARGTRTG